jgi:hypothetical protein
MFKNLLQHNLFQIDGAQSFTNFDKLFVEFQKLIPVVGIFNFQLVNSFICAFQIL